MENSIASVHPEFFCEWSEKNLPRTADFTSDDSRHSRYATTSFIGANENSRYKYRVATDMAKTVGTIMILLYGVGGEPGEGEIPMTRLSRP